MKESNDKKVLIVTKYCDNGYSYDYWGENISQFFRYHYLKKISYGLRFLKKNIPEIEILEYPTKQEYIKKLDEGFDIVGFSFFTSEIPTILEMVQIAQDKNIAELWAGHYGALTDGIEQYFDKVFIGYAEQAVGKELQRPIERVKHPVLIDAIGLPNSIPVFPLGILFTSRGCNIGCNFCQTPLFCNKPHPIPLASIEEVLIQYKQLGIKEIVIPDEDFGLQKKHTEQVVKLLSKYKMNWHPMTRIDILKTNMKSWFQNGLSGALLGIESIRQNQINKTGKNIKVQDTKYVLKELYKKNAFVIGYYILGFEDDTKQSIKKSIKKLVKYSIDMVQLCISTPFPKTPLWDEIEKKYGIFETDWSKWDTKHLVWNHPLLSKEQMEQLLKWGMHHAYPKKRFIETPIKFYRLRIKRYGRNQAAIDLMNNFWVANARYRFLFQQFQPIRKKGKK